MKIAITGAQGTGKSTLIDSLSDFCVKNKIVKVTELTRTIAKTHKINELGNDETQKLIIQGHYNTFNNDKFITDRCALDGLVYTTYLYDNNQISDNVMNLAYDMFDNLIYKYDYIFYVKPEFELIDDGVRSINIDFRNEIVSLFEHFIYDRRLNVYVLSGTVEERKNKFLQIIKDKK